MRLGKQIVIQPDGKLAVWSSVVDDFILVDATAEEVIEDWVAREVKHIRQRVEDVVAALSNGGKPYFQFTRSFAACVETIRQQHGDDAESLQLLRL